MSRIARNVGKALQGHASSKPACQSDRDLRGWADDDIRRQMLDVIWKEVGDVANAPPHPKGRRRRHV